MPIATPYEIQRNSTTGKTVEIEQICMFLNINEEHIFNSESCLGRKFYQNLQSDVFIPNPTVAFQLNIVYLVGTFVVFQGEVWEVMIPTTGTETPANGNHFTLPKKFNTVANEILWKRYLVQIIAITVMISCYLDSATPYTAAGLVKPKGETFDAAKQPDIDVKTVNLQKTRDMAIKNLESFLVENPDSYPFAAACQNLCGDKNEILPKLQKTPNFWNGIDLR